MMTLVDTSVWSRVFRKKAQTEEDARLRRKVEVLSKQGEAVVIGAVRQEALSGFSDAARFERMRLLLSAYEDFPVTTDDYVTAARFFNLCRSRGVQGSHIDFLISAVAFNNGFDILTLDADFPRYRAHVGISLAEI